MTPSRSAATVASGLLLVTSSLGGCHRSTAESAAPALEVATETASDAQGSLLPARCHRTDLGFALTPSEGIDDLEVGDAVPYPGGYAVGLVHRTSAGRVGAIALLARDPLRLGRIVDLGPTLGDAPPPRVAWRGPDLVAASYARVSASAAPLAHPVDTRDVALSSIVADAPILADARAPLVISQHRDDSLALDLAFSGPTGLLVWDEATSAPRGVVKAAVFARDHAGAAHDVSPPESDAELPRVVPAGAGFAVLWIARRPEPPMTDASESEATGELRTFGSLEMIVIDDRGNASGPVRRLTPTSGHVSAYDVEARPGDGGPTLIVVARDDGEAVDGSGGALLRVRVRGDTVEAAVAFETDGLGRGGPNFVSSFPTAGSPSGSGPFALAWVGKDEDPRFLPLDAEGSPTALPSSEDGLKDARPLVFVDRLPGAPPGSPANPASGRTMLVAAPSDVVAQLRVFACTK